MSVVAVVATLVSPSFATLSPPMLALSSGWLLGVLAAIALLSALRQARHAHRRGDAGWRLVALVLAPFALAALLWPTLAPPLREIAAGTLVVATADTPADVVLAVGERLIALPEARPSPATLSTAAASVGGPAGPTLATAEAVPDLATALRRHPQTRALRILGAGLAARDRDAARGLALRFAPAPLPAGIVELQAPLQVSAGRRFVASGRVEGGAGQTLELLDPGGAVRARQPLDAAGRFTLAAAAGPAGRMPFRLQRRDGAGAVVETLELPLQVRAGAPLRVLVLAGGVNPENKYLRRWALDAGLALTTQASVGGGVDIGQPVGATTAARLAEFDLVLLDERSWRALGAGGRAELRRALRDGLGVLLRLGADPSTDEIALLHDWGFAVAAAELAREVTLPGSELADAAGVGPPATDAPATATAEAAATDQAPPLRRRALRLAATDGTPLLRDGSGEPLAVWRGEGRGRIAVWNLGDTFRLQLGNRAAAYGELWAAATGTLARARGNPPTATPVVARIDERSVFCGLGSDARVVAPDGGKIPLLVDPASAGAACAAFWPALPGWHALHIDADAAASGFFVRAADEAPALARADLRDATLALATAALPAPAALVATQPGPRWPWFVAWLLLAGLAWWFERSRLGRGSRS